MLCRSTRRMWMCRSVLVCGLRGQLLTFQSTLYRPLFFYANCTVQWGQGSSTHEWQIEKDWCISKYSVCSYYTQVYNKLWHMHMQHACTATCEQRDCVHPQPILSCGPTLACMVCETFVHTRFRVDYTLCITHMMLYNF